MLGRVTKYRVNNDAPSEVFDADSPEDRAVSDLESSYGAGVLCFAC